MNPKQLMIAGTMALAVTIRNVIGQEQAAGRYPCYRQPGGINRANKADLPQLLGVTSEEIQERLYAGESLADIAVARHADIDEVIELQVAEMTALLRQRLQSGALSPEAFHRQCSELREVLQESAFRRMREQAVAEPQLV
ncbi:hypothetical protein PA598K_06606 [Paenibacillus sp. 598K]|uniref:hypothetical protein n=1 Tax=Paenibacillus sp. 598K TaxID=1117987 RepID=UPI000FF9826D|nr:hypothetical protein [Paenibacillus sp. 598K]GBF78009.1 hypothetical protein PA598K_06606 [Paenibacillus sp. 598K]